MSVKEIKNTDPSKSNRVDFVICICLDVLQAIANSTNFSVVWNT